MTRSALFALAALALLAPSVQADQPPVFSTEDGAIRGYDPVAYFVSGQPVKGSPLHTFDYNGATFHFASTENLSMFRADPQRYAPQYGGYCAFAVSKGATAPIDPRAWSIVGDKLYLNYSLDVRAMWRTDIPGHIEAADGNWPGVLR